MGALMTDKAFERRRRDIDVQWSQVAQSAANTILTITQTSDAGRRIYVDTIDVSLITAAAGNDIAVELRENSTTGFLRWRTQIGNAATRGTRVGIVREYDPFEFPPGVDAVLTIAAAGAAAVIDATLTGFSSPVGCL